MARDERGTIVILAAFMLPLVLFVIGAGIDYTNAIRARAGVATALDASLLAAARDLSIGQIDARDVNEQVNEYFDANIQGAKLGHAHWGEVKTTLNETYGTLSGTIGMNVDTAFAKILNAKSIDINVDAQAVYNILDIELALVLDVTGSMGGQKLRDMKEASKNLIDILLPRPGNSSNNHQPNKVRISMVPYSDLVNVGQFERAITGYTSNESCVYERAVPYAFTDAAPVGRVAGFGPDDDGIVNYVSGWMANRPEKSIINDPRNFRGYRCNNPELMPLTGNRTQLKNRIDSLGASGATAGHIGIQWGWYTLSPHFNTVWPGQSEPRAYNERGNLKVMVIMTDGVFNTWYEDDQGTAYNQGDALCRNIKDENVMVYTVAFRAPGSAENFLRRCASGPDYYFETTTGTALRSAFEQIAERLRALRLSS